MKMHSADLTSLQFCFWKRTSVAISAGPPDPPPSPPAPSHQSSAATPVVPLHWSRPRRLWSALSRRGWTSSLSTSCRMEQCKLVFLSRPNLPFFWFLLVPIPPLHLMYSSLFSSVTSSFSPPSLSSWEETFPRISMSCAKNSSTPHSSRLFSLHTNTAEKRVSDPETQPLLHGSVLTRQTLYLVKNTTFYSSSKGLVRPNSDRWSTSFSYLNASLKS